jgi:uncharacterized phosphosugar-binding protein
MLVEELFCRAGGLGCVNGILEPALMPHSGADKSSRLEQVPALARVVFEDEDIRSGDLVIAISHSGINPVVVEFAALTRERGIPLVAVTSLQHSRATPSRHSSGKRLCDLATVVIDTGCPLGDAVMEIEGLRTRVAAMSTVAGAVIAGGERGNLQFRARYGARIKRL